MCSGISPLMPRSWSNITSANTTLSKGSPFSKARSIVAMLSFPKEQLAMYSFGFSVFIFLSPLKEKECKAARCTPFPKV